MKFIKRDNIRYQVYEETQNEVCVLCDFKFADGIKTLKLWWDKKYLD